MRSPGTAVVELVGHKKGRDGAVNAIAWGCEGRAGQGGGGWIASCGESPEVERRVKTTRMTDMT